VRARVRLAARGSHSAESDVDVAVRAPGVDLLELAARLSLALELEVDVVDLDAATIPLLRSVLADGVPVASNAPGALGTFYAHALVDLETDGPAYDRMARSYVRRLAGGSAPW
jgi:hypothetical protein